MKFHEYLKYRRTQLGKTLRVFCKENKIDPGNWSNMERGLLLPPSEKYLEKYAKALQLDMKTSPEEYVEFFDLAAVARKRIPKDLYTGVNVEMLPVIFKILRGKKIDDFLAILNIQGVVK